MSDFYSALQKAIHEVVVTHEPSRDMFISTLGKVMSELIVSSDQSDAFDCKVTLRR